MPVLEQSFVTIEQLMNRCVTITSQTKTLHFLKSVFYINTFATVCDIYETLSPIT